MWRTSSLILICILMTGLFLIAIVKDNALEECRDTRARQAEQLQHIWDADADKARAEAAYFGGIRYLPK